MEKMKLTLPAMKVMGVQVRTNTEREQNPVTAEIGLMVQSYFQKHTAAKIPHRKDPGVTFCVYSQYESDWRGDYDCLFGEEIKEEEEVEGLVSQDIPAQTYIKFTTEPGPLPMVVIEAWQYIWSLSDEELGGKRAYKADFERYDERAWNSQDAIVDIYIGIED